MARLRVSDAAERTLETWLDQVMKGEIRDWDLPLCVSAWLHAGEAYGRASRQPEIDQLTAQVNYLHYQLIPANERRAEVEQRLAARLQHATAHDWDELEATLKQIATPSAEAAPAAEEEQHDSRRTEAA